MGNRQVRKHDKKAQAILESAMTIVVILLLLTGTVILWSRIGNNFLLRLDGYKQNRLNEVNGASSLDTYGEYIKTKGNYEIFGSKL